MSASYMQLCAMILYKICYKTPESPLCNFAKKRV
nr:MAG TPA: hypothetical protein [Caudoviricetes sp.]DAW87743.1 MAG TPA: hypothetical protein [Caudoviricetes sp.]